MSTKHQRGGRRNPVPVLGTDGRSLTGHRTTRSRTAMVGGVALGLTAATLAGMPAQAINTNPPGGPGNVEIFTKRDMVAIEGYSEFAGKQAKFTVTRNGTVIGSAIGTVDGTGFLETNHPGGICWGAGTDLKVTPDIQGGDEVRVDFLGTPAVGTSPNQWDGAKVQDVEITDVVTDDDAFKLTLNGRYGPGVDMPGADLAVDPGKFGVEIVNPDMRDGTSSIGERAIGWPGHVPDPTDPEPPPTGYTVDGSVTGSDTAGGTFSVTYDFEKASDLDLALAGEHVALAWQANHEDPNQEAQFGLTMWENGESAGPGMGGCPAGPQGIRADSPTVYTGKGAGVGSGGIEVTWQAANVAPAAPAITGYSVRAVSGENEVGKRVGADVTSTTLTGLVEGEIYTVEIASRSDNGESSPVASMRLQAGEHIVPGATATTAREPVDGKYLPLVTTAAGADFGVHLDPVLGLIDAEVHYTTDGSTPTLQSDTFVSGVSESIQIRQDTTVKWIVVDSGNIVGPMGSQVFDIAESGAEPPAITNVVAAPVSGAVDVTFGKLDDATAYRVQAYNADGTVRIGNPVNAAQPTDPAVTEVTRRMVGLTNGTEHRFTVAARIGTTWTSESAVSAPVAPEAAAKAEAGADQTVLRGRPFTLDGSASPKVTSYRWTQIKSPATATTAADPALDMNPTANGVQAATAVSTTPTFTATFPLLTTATSDHKLQFRLTTTHSDGTTKSDLVEVTGQPDAVGAEEVRWRAGDEIGGTGSQENATLTFLNGGPTGTLIGQVLITNGEWEYPGGTPGLLNGTIYVWSNYGYTGTIITTD